MFESPQPKPQRCVARLALKVQRHLWIVELAISEVRLDRRSQAVTIVTDDTTWRLGVMSANRASLAFADMNVFWRETSQRLNMANVSQVDLRWHNQVVLRYHAVAPIVERAA